MNFAVVTGADGFVGSNLLSFLDKMSIPAIALIVKKSKTISTISCLKNVRIVECDLCHCEKINLHIPSGAITTFYHFAWNGVSPEARLSFQEQYVNIELSLNALKLAKQIKAERFITLGSTMEYMYAGKPIDKNALPTPQNAYGAAKLAVRYLCQALAKEENISFIYTVATGVYGPKRLDNNVISYTIKKLLQKQRPSYTNLEQLWDYIYIDDLVEALYLIGEKGQAGAFYAIGHGDNCHLSEYIYTLHNLIDPNVPLGIGDLPYETSELPSSCVDLSALKQDTGFEPKISFENGAKKVIDFLRENNRRL